MDVSNINALPNKRTVYVNFYSDGSCAYFDSQDDADFFGNYMLHRERVPRAGNRAYPVEIDE